MKKPRDLSWYISWNELKKELKSHIIKSAEILKKDLKEDKKNLKDNWYLINA